MNRVRTILKIAVAQVDVLETMTSLVFKGFREQLERRLVESGLWDRFVAFLAARGLEVPEDVLNRDVTQAVEASPAVPAVLLDIDRGDPALAELCESLVDLDEGIQEWRYRHVKMVERTIGMQMGTGGSAGGM